MDKIKIIDTENSEEKAIRDLSVFDGLPESVSWQLGDKVYSLENSQKIVFKLLEKDNLIAIIEAPFSKQLNKAYIVNGQSEIVMDVSESFKEKYNCLFGNSSAIFSDIYYIGEKLFYFLFFNGVDYRIEIDTRCFSVGGLIESR